MAKQDDGLFLLEVLVDKIVFLKSPCFSDKDFRTCVNIQCPAVDPLEICDDDPGSCIAKGGGPFEKSFNSGKSCLFSLNEADISKAMSSFPIKITVYKSLPCGCLPTKIVMGEATIDMTKEFVQARKKFLEDPNNVSYEALKDSFHLLGSDKSEAGHIAMFLRISCFGKLIVTRFQGGSSPPNLTGGGGGGSSTVDRSCFPRKDYQTLQDPCVCGASKLGGGPGGAGAICSAPCKRGDQIKGSGVCPPAKDPYNSMPCEEPDDPCYCTGPKPQKPQKMVCRNTHQYCLHVPKGPTKGFEEIGSNLTGNELRIKVPASASVIKKISQTHCIMQSPYTKSSSDGPCEPPCGKNQISLALPNEATCCRGVRPQGTQFTCTTEGCTQALKHAVLGRGDANKGQQETVANNRDCFVLKVAKTAVQGDRKCKLELEFVTPKGPDKKQPIRNRSLRVSTDPDCYCCARGAIKAKGRKKR